MKQTKPLLWQTYVLEHKCMLVVDEFFPPPIVLVSEMYVDFSFLFFDGAIERRSSSINRGLFVELNPTLEHVIS